MILMCIYTIHNAGTVEVKEGQEILHLDLAISSRNPPRRPAPISCAFVLSLSTMVLAGAFLRPFSWIGERLRERRAETLRTKVRTNFGWEKRTGQMEGKKGEGQP